MQRDQSPAPTGFLRVAQDDRPASFRRQSSRRSRTISVNRAPVYAASQGVQNRAACAPSSSAAPFSFVGNAAPRMLETTRGAGDFHQLHERGKSGGDRLRPEPRSRRPTRRGEAALCLSSVPRCVAYACAPRGAFAADSIRASNRGSNSTGWTASSRRKKHGPAGATSPGLCRSGRPARSSLYRENARGIVAARREEGHGARIAGAVDNEFFANFFVRPRRRQVEPAQRAERGRLRPAPPEGHEAEEGQQAASAAAPENNGATFRRVRASARSP